MDFFSVACTAGFTACFAALVNSIISDFGQLWIFGDFDGSDFVMQQWW